MYPQDAFPCHSFLLLIFRWRFCILLLLTFFYLSFEFLQIIFSCTVCCKFWCDFAGVHKFTLRCFMKYWNGQSTSSGSQRNQYSFLVIAYVASCYNQDKLVSNLSFWSSSKWWMFGTVFRKQLTLLLNPLANAEQAVCGFVSAIVDNMVSCLSQSFTKSFTYSSLYSIIRQFFSFTIR